MKALIIHDEEMFRYAFKSIIREIHDFKLILELDTIEEINSLSPFDCMDIAIVIIKSDCLENGRNQYWDILNRICPPQSIIIMGTPNLTSSEWSDAITIQSDITINQITYLLKNLLPTSVSKPMAAHPKQNDYIKSSHADHLRNKPRTDLARFSNRKLEILELVSKGFNNKRIAQELNVAEGTIKAHMHLIMKMAKATNRTQLALWYNNFT